MERTSVIEFIEAELDSLSYDEDNFLYIISTYLKGLEYQEPIHELMPKIRKAIKHIEKNFDEVFLLVSANGEENLFLESQNRDLLNCLDFLISVLEKFDYIFEADKLNQIKAKLSLGYERYFIFENSKKVVKWFSSVDMDFECYNDFDLKSETDVFRILSELIKVNIFSEFDNLKEVLENFPSNIYRNSSLDLVEIKQSLFFDVNFEFEEFENLNVKTSEPGDLDVAVKCLEILNLKK